MAIGSLLWPQEISYGHRKPHTMHGRNKRDTPFGQDRNLNFIFQANVKLGCTRISMLFPSAWAAELNFQFHCCDVHVKFRHKLIPNIEIGGRGDNERQIAKFENAFILVPFISPMYGLPIIAFSYTVQQNFRHIIFVCARMTSRMCEHSYLQQLRLVHIII